MFIEQENTSQNHQPGKKDIQLLILVIQNNWNGITNHQYWKCQKKENKTSGGLYLPEGTTVGKRSNGAHIFAEVVVIGDCLGDKVGKLKVGDEVFFDVNHPSTVELDGQEYYLLHYNQILGYEPKD